MDLGNRGRFPRTSNQFKFTSKQYTNKRKIKSW